MLRKLLAPFAALVLAAAAPDAIAEAPADYGCRILNATVGEATGEGVFVGVAGGYAVTGDTQTVSMRCFVKINGVDTEASTPTGTGTGAAASVGRVEYVMNDGDSVELCIEVTWGSDYFSGCEATLLVDAPPQVFLDTLRPLLDFTDGVCATAGLDPCSNGICVVNTGTCSGGTCVVNTGTCERGGFCVVNTGDCFDHGFCVVNSGTCGRRPQADPGGVGKPLLPLG